MSRKYIAVMVGLMIAASAQAQVITPLGTEHEGKTGLKDLVTVVNQNMTNLAAAINAGSNALVITTTTITSKTVVVTNSLSVRSHPAGNVAMGVVATNMPTDCISTGDAPAWLRIHITGSTNLYVVPAYRISGP
jgi:hypothetical protein